MMCRTSINSLELYQFPGVQVALTKGKPSGGTEGCVVDHLGFRVKNLSVKKLTAGGAKVISENPKIHQMFIEFPDAIKVEITEDKAQSDPAAHHHIYFAVQEIGEQRAWYGKTLGTVS